VVTFAQSCPCAKAGAEKAINKKNNAVFNVQFFLMSQMGNKFFFIQIKNLLFKKVISALNLLISFINSKSNSYTNKRGNKQLQ
jgi:hypothetical protein